MTDEQERRAVAWLDAHPEVVEAAGEAAWQNAGSALCHWNGLKVAERNLLLDDQRAALVAFLTSPLPCAACTPKQGDERHCGFCGALVGHFHALDCSTYGPGGHIGPRPQAVVEGTECPDCADGTAGILLDQLEARYEQVGWRRKYLPPYAHLGVGFSTNEGVDDPLVKKEPVFRKLPSPEEGR